ncbi:MAG: branched-chain amino acid ABC transporter substrate-binding protein [Gaiellaceae bacterium]
MKKLLTLASVVLVAAVASTIGQAKPAASTATAAPASASANAVIKCLGRRGPRIGFLGPFTGPAASIGQEQLKWGRYANRRNNRAAGQRLKIRVIERDTQLDARQASTRAVQLAADPRVLAVVGPAGSQEILSVAATFRSKSLAYISGSATRTDLTVGQNRITNFFRVVGNDRAQAATDAGFIYDTLKARRVWIIDDQSSYSVPLASDVERLLKARSGTTVSRESVNQQQNDFSSLIARIPANTQAIFLPWQLAAQAATFYQQLRTQGKSATVLGSDGLDAKEWVQTANNQYFSAFAPDLKRFPDKATKALVAGYVREFGQFNTTFGPPTYVAMQVAQLAIHAACKDGKASRAEVFRRVRLVRFPSILGYRISFRGGDVAAAKFFLFKVQNGQAVFVK